MRNLVFIVAVFWISPSWAADSDVSTGEKLLQQCQKVIKFQDSVVYPDDSFGLAYCLGLVKGVSTTYKLLFIAYDEIEPSICIPQQSTNMQLVRVVVKFLKENPQLLHKEAVMLTLGAFRTAFPCSEID